MPSHRAAQAEEGFSDGKPATPFTLHGSILPCFPDNSGARVFLRQTELKPVAKFCSKSIFGDAPVEQRRSDGSGGKV